MQRARYNGASGTGVDLTVTLPDGQTTEVQIPPDGLTPETVLGQPFPESLARSLAEQADWELVDEKPAKHPTKTGGDAGGKE